MPLGVTRMPPSIFEPRSPTSAPNSFLFLVPESGKLPCTHQVALSARVFITASPFPALRFSKKPRITRLFSSMLIATSIELHQLAQRFQKLTFVTLLRRGVQSKLSTAPIREHWPRRDRAVRRGQNSEWFCALRPPGLSRYSPPVLLICARG